MSTKLSLWLLVAILVGSLVRLINLSHLPPGFTPDEAAFGYNAYSLLLTGSDEWGTPWYRLWFTNLRSFGDYKPPLYAFMVVPSVALFGLSEYSTRLPNALLGTLAIPVLYVLAIRLTNRRLIGVMAALFLAVSPWHISLSRGAFEANLATLLFPLAISLFISGRYYLASTLFAVNFYSYHTARLLTLPIIVVLTLFYRPPKKIHLPGLLLFILLLPGIFSFLNGGSARISDTGIFNPTDKWAAVSKDRFTAVVSGLPDPLARLFHNKPVFIASQFIRNYLGYFSPRFLFTDGPGEGTYGMLPGRGVAYLVQLPLLLAFVALLFKSLRPYTLLILIFLLMSPLPASLAKGVGFAANRSAVMAPFITLASALGFVYLTDLSLHFKKYLTFTFFIFFSVSLVSFLLSYRYLSPHQIGTDMLFGRREAMDRVLTMSHGFDQIRISKSLSEPHIYLAFYSQLDPRVYQYYSQTWPDFAKMGFPFLDQYDGYMLGKYRFGSLQLGTHPPFPTLLVGSPSDYPQNYPQYFHIDAQNGETVIQVSPLTK